MVLTYKVFKSFFYVLVTLLLSSCAPKINLSYYQPNQYYKTEYNDSVYFFQFTEKGKRKVSGNFYSVADQLYADQQTFKVPIRKLHKKAPFIADTAILYNIPAIPPFYPERYKKELYQIEIIKNITFAEVKGHWDSYVTDNESYFDIFKKGITSTITNRNLNLKMDIYQPLNAGNQLRPFLMIIHGGAFYIGDKESIPIVEFCKYFASLGYTTASINYRLGFLPNKNSVERTGYNAVQDAHAAMRFMIENRNKYLIDTSLIFVCGTSAGAITALNLAFMQNSTRPESTQGGFLSSDLGDIESSGNSFTHRFSIQAVGNMWGAINDLNHLRSSNTAVVSFHGNKDRIVPYGYDYPFEIISKDIGKVVFGKMYGSFEIHKMLKKLNRREQLYTFDGFDHEPHVFSNGQPNSKHHFIKTNMADFFYVEMVPKNIEIVKFDQNLPFYAINETKLNDILWGIDGGFIISQSGNTVRVVWKNDALFKSLSVSGRYSNGASFFKTIEINN